MVFSLLCKPDASVLCCCVIPTTKPTRKEYFLFFSGWPSPKSCHLETCFPVIKFTPSIQRIVRVLVIFPLLVFCGILAADDGICLDSHYRRAAANSTHKLCRSAKQLQQSLKKTLKAVSLWRSLQLIISQRFTRQVKSTLNVGSVLRNIGNITRSRSQGRDCFSSN